MAAWQWRNSPEVVARIVDEGEIRGILKQNVQIGPGEVAILLVEGRVADSLTQTTLKNFGGGMGTWFGKYKGQVGKKRLLFAYTTPFDLPFKVLGHTSDGQEVKGIANFRCSITHADANKLIGLMRGIKVLTRKWLLQKFHNEVISQVVNPRIAQIPAEQFRANKEFRDDLETSAQIEMKKTMSQNGLTIQKFYASWGPTEYDRLIAYETEMDMLEKRKEIGHESKLNELRRRHEDERKIIEMDWDLKRAGVEGAMSIELEKKKAQLEAERLQFDQQFQFQSQSLDLEMRKKREEAELKRQSDAAETDNAMKMFEQVQAKKAARQAAERDFQMAQMDRTNVLQERILSQAMDTGIMDSSNINEFLKQQTMQKAADRSDAKMSSVAAANTPQPGAPAPAAPPPAAPAPAAQPQGEMGGMSPPGASTNCPTCGEAVQSNFALCPFCGNNL